MIGAKNFSEQFILAEMMAGRLRAEGASVQTREGLGSAVIFRALAAGDLDAYVDYSGTLWTNVLGRRDIPTRQAMLAALKTELKARYGVTLLGPLGFENAYALAMTGDKAEAAGGSGPSPILARPASPRLRSSASDLEFPQPAGMGGAEIRQAYGLSFRAQRSYNPTFMYRALNSGEADVISAFSSDGRIAADHLTVLGDPRHAIPSYDAVVLISPRRAGDARLKAALQPLIGRIPVEAMRQANLTVDRDQDKITPAEAARKLERSAPELAIRRGRISKSPSWSLDMVNEESVRLGR